jgi:hypothetical protein
MPCKVVLFYTQFQRGWTETWYHNESDPRTLLRTVLNEIKLNNASQFRHQNTFLVAARATSTIGQRLSYSISYGTKYHGTAKRTNQKTPDVASTDAVIKVDGVQFGTKRMFIRGLNDDDVTRTVDGTDAAVGGLLTGMADYVNSMAAGSFAIRTLDKPPTNGTVWYGVVKIIPVAGDIPHSDVITKKPTGGEITLETRVRFARVPFDNLPGFPANSEVIEIGPGGLNGVRINYYLREQAPVFPVSMQLVVLQYSYPIIKPVLETDIQFERFSERKTGRPFGLQRGRARAKVRAL